jgi:hypothetical protein
MKALRIGLGLVLVLAGLLVAISGGIGVFAASSSGSPWHVIVTGVFLAVGLIAMWGGYRLIRPRAGAEIAAADR